MTEQLGRSFQVRRRAHADEDPIEAGATQVDPRVAPELVAQLAHAGARQPHIDLTVVAVRDLARAKPQRVGVSTKARRSHPQAAHAPPARHELVEHAADARSGVRPHH